MCMTTVVHIKDLLHKNSATTGLESKLTMDELLASVHYPISNIQKPVFKHKFNNKFLEAVQNGFLLISCTN